MKAPMITFASVQPARKFRSKSASRALRTEKVRLRRLARRKDKQLFKLLGDESPVSRGQNDYDVV